MILYKGRIKCRIYLELITFVICDNFAKDDFLNKTFSEGFENCDALVFNHDDKNGVNLWIDKAVLNYKPGKLASIIAQECVHVANDIFKTRGILPDLENDEPFAYLLTYLVKQIYKHIEKYNASNV